MKKSLIKSFSTNINNNKTSLYDQFNHNYITSMNFRTTADKFNVFRVYDEDGKILNKEYDNLDKETALKIFDNMIKINTFDVRFNMAQREGKISFYMTCVGEEASTVASTAALNDDDLIYPQYREAASLLYRGFTTTQMTNQLTSNNEDLGKGRQMPVHYGSKKHHYQTVSSPLCTQLPQASGAGYHYRVKNMDKICVTYFGEGAASEGDFHPALNFAATLKSQTLFYCRNNMYAISTPIDDQYKGDGIAARGISYGIQTLRVDGNDVLAVYNAVKQARKLIVTNKVPVVIESMSYRGGDHSTSDYSKLYRDEKEMKKWTEYLEKMGNPINRFSNYLKSKNWICDKHQETLVAKYREEARDELKRAMSVKKPSIDSMFDDVYEEVPEMLKEQKKDLHNHLKLYGDNYNVNQYH